MNAEHMHNIESAFHWFQEEAHGLSKAKGWYDNRSRSYMELYGLIISELGELAEAFRETEMPESDKLTGFTLAEEEAADVYIRIADLCGYFGFRPGEVIAKWITQSHNDITGTFNGFYGVIDYLTVKAPILSLIADEDEAHELLHYEYISNANPLERIGRIAKSLGYADSFAWGQRCIAAALVELACLSNEHDISLGETILCKHEYNKGRAPRHGGKLY